MTEEQPRWASTRPDTIARDLEVLRVIRASIRDSKLPPSRWEIAAALGLPNRESVDRSIKRLQRQGLIEVVPGTARGLRLKGANTKALTEEM